MIWLHLKPCVRNFEMLVESNRIDDLIAWIQSNTLANHNLAFALEILGHANVVSCVEIITSFLSHPKPIIRESALLGLGAALFQSKNSEQKTIIIEKLKDIIVNDSSPGVRMTCRDVLEDLA